MAEELSKGFEPKEIERRWYAYWQEHGVFAASDAPDDVRPRYVLPMPLPNVTGSLHMGHALMCTIEDVLTRAHRMLGFNTLYQPGTDHAGIATQVVVERQLKRENLTRHDLGREKFIERVWEWKGECGSRIVEQQQVLGLSADWDRSVFTMDAGYSRAVREAFVRLHHEGLIYRAKRLIYWDCTAQTVLSNLEVDSEEENGELYEFAYPVEGGGEIVVATTRPETMLGDSAVAIHPDDERYTALHGKFVLHPFLDRKNSDRLRRNPRRSDLRNRCGQGDAGSRLQRLRDGPTPSAGAHRDFRCRGPCERGGWVVRRARALRGA